MREALFRKNTQAKKTPLDWEAECHGTAVLEHCGGDSRS